MPRAGRNIYCQYDPTAMANALEAMRGGKSVRQASIEFDIPRSTLAEQYANS